jgi:hypothetical protein
VTNFFSSNRFWTVAFIFTCGLAACGPTTSAPDQADAGVSNGGADAYIPPLLFDDGGVCGATKTKAQAGPLDINVMLDQSSSMLDTVGTGSSDKWDTVTAALKQFINQGTGGLSVGIQYFGLPPSGGAFTCNVDTCNTDADCGNAACGPCADLFGFGYKECGGYGLSSSDIDSCDAADYGHDEVEIGALPGNATALSSSIDAHSPTTSTPTSAALQGAIDHAHDWAQSHAGDNVIVIFATDGDPTECDTDLNDIDAIAASGASEGIKTYVIGVGPSLSALNGIASSGGTSSAYLVDTGGNVTQQFIDAMNSIRATALGCNYNIPVPTTGTANFNAVNVQYAPGNGGAEKVYPNVGDAGHCGSSNGWYYDDPSNPTQIILCPQSCNTVKADTAGEVDVLLGCGTIIS